MPSVPTLHTIRDPLPLHARILTGPVELTVISTHTLGTATERLIVVLAKHEPSQVHFAGVVEMQHGQPKPLPGECWVFYDDSDGDSFAAARRIEPEADPVAEPAPE